MISSIKKLLPNNVKQWIILLRERMRFALIWLFSRSRFTSSLYYVLCSVKFHREHQAVLQGRLSYHARQGMKQDSNTLLRRNIHRIEKGLIMQPRKPVFALDYIKDTVAAFGMACNNPEHDMQELKWAADVLSEYFNVVDKTMLDDSCELLFENFKTQYAKISEQSDGNSIPYTFASKPIAAISPEQFHTLCRQRRSVRWFDDKPVDKALLEQAITMASLAPSACNRQPYRFYISEDKGTAKRLLDVPAGTRGFADNVPCTIVVAADLANYPTEKDRHLVYIDGSLAAMQLMLALETLGLSSCPINFPDVEHSEAELAGLLSLDVNIRPVMMICVGYGNADGKIPFSHKKTATQLSRYVSLAKEDK